MWGHGAGCVVALPPEQMLRSRPTASIGHSGSPAGDFELLLCPRLACWSCESVACYVPGCLWRAMSPVGLLSNEVVLIGKIAS